MLRRCIGSTVRSCDGHVRTNETHARAVVIFLRSGWLDLFDKPRRVLPTRTTIARRDTESKNVCHFTDHGPIRVQMCVSNISIRQAERCDREAVGTTDLAARLSWRVG